MDITVIQTGTANLASVVVAFERLGLSVDVTNRSSDVVDASAIVLPGVGTFAAGCASLADSGLRPALAERVRARRPTLGICLGLQLLANASSESPGVVGLGVVDAGIDALNESAPVPQIGWNRVGAGNLVAPGWAYFANSFALTDEPAGWTASWAVHGDQRFVAALESGGVLACQFHPELSGAWGAQLLQRWVERVSC